MIHDQDFPIFLCAKACNMMVYIKNRSPHKIFDDKTPEEAFTSVNAKGKPLTNVWLSSVYTCIQTQEDHDGALQHKGCVYVIQPNFTIVGTSFLRGYETLILLDFVRMLLPWMLGFIILLCN